jgi:ribosomal protein L37E
MEGYIFEEDGKTYLVRCPECKQENYAMNVSTGICTWCGYDANEKLPETGEQIKEV